MDVNPMDEQLNQIETRLSKIEKTLNIILKSPWLESYVKNTLSAEETANTWKEPLEPTPSRATQPEVNPPDTTTIKSGNWLGIIAIICFILAAGFIIKLSIDSGWLTPIRQLSIAALFGIILIIAGFALMDSDREYASLLPAAGVITLFITTFAAYRFYSVISFQVATAITTLISGLCIGLYLKLKHDIYAIIAALGAYTAPILFELNTTSLFSLYYFVCCSFTFATISIWAQSRTLTIIAAYLAVLVNAYVGIDLHQDALIATLLPLHFIIFSIGTFLYTRITQMKLTEKESWSFFPVLIIFYAVEYFFIDRSFPSFAPWISLAFAGFLVSLYLIAKNRQSTEEFKSGGMIITFATLVFFHAFYLEILPTDARPFLFIFILLAYNLFPKTTVYQNKLFFAPLAALVIISVVEYISIIYHLVENDFSIYWFTLASLAFFGIWLTIILHRDEVILKNERAYLVLGTAHLLAITGLYDLTNDISSLAVSASWLFYAMLVIGFAFFRKDKVMARSALFVLAFAAGKALLYDASSAPTTIRILCLLLTGLVLYGSGFIMRKISAWK